MERDIELFSKVIVEIFVTSLWLGAIGTGLWVALLWVQINRDRKIKAGLLSKIFPVFIFSSNALSESNQHLRGRFFLAFTSFLLLMAACVLVAIFNPDGLSASDFN